MILSIGGCGSPKAEMLSENFDISTQEFNRLLQDSMTLLLDVRTAEEIADGMIPGAKHLDFHSKTFEAELKKLSQEKTVIAYCRSGGRSGSTCTMLSEMGYKNVFNYGGYERWLKENN